MSELQQLQEQIQTKLPDAKYLLLDTTPSKPMTLRVTYINNELLISIEHETVY